jgi:hypothetical protein
MSRSGQHISSAEHLTEIKMLIKHNEQLLERLLMPVSTLGSMALPYILGPFLEEGRLLHSLCVTIAAMFNSEEYEPRWVGSLAVALPADLKTAGLRITNLTSNQELIVNTLINFNNIIKKQLVSFQALDRLGGGPLEFFLKKTIFEILQIEATLLETQRLSLPPTDTYAEIKISDLIKTNLKKEFLRAYLSLNGIIKLPTTEMKTFNKQKSTLQTGNIVNFLYTVDADILQKNFYELVGMLNSSYQQLIHEFKLEDSGVVLMALSSMQSNVVNYLISPQLILIPIIAGVLLQKYVIYPPLKWLYRKYDGSQALIETSKKYLSREEAYQLLQSLRKKNAQIEAFSSMNYRIFGLAFPLMALLLAVYDYREYNRISPQIFIAGLCSISALVREVGAFASNAYEHKKFKGKMAKINQNLNIAVACTDKEWKKHIGQNISQSYFQITGKKYRDLKPVTVLDAIKYIFLKNTTAQLISPARQVLVIEPLLLKATVAATINSQIKLYLDRLSNISRLKQQIQKIFQTDDIIEVKKLDAQGLPGAEFLIDSRDIINLNLHEIEELFSDCKVTQQDGYLRIEGSDPAYTPDYESFVSTKTIRHRMISRNRDTLSLAKRKDIKHTAVKKDNQDSKKTRNDTPNLLGMVDCDSDEKKSTTIKWSSRLIFNSRIKSKEVIQPINHPVFKNHYVVFNIPKEAFPTNDLYQAAKDKVEERRIARSSVGAQGLQFRTGVATNGQETFNYELRAKILGANGKGDIRLFAKPHAIVMNQQKMIVHEFIAADINAH